MLCFFKKLFKKHYLYRNFNNNFMWTLSLIIITLTTFMYSCNFNQSVSVNSSLNLITAGDGLSCEKISITDSDGKEFSNTSFIYGQEVFINFTNVSGFVKEDGYYFPGMKLMIVSSSKDTVLYYDDLYEQYDDLESSMQTLMANITMAKPIHSGENYTAYLFLWDKKGKGTFKAEFKFSVISNPSIKVKTNNVKIEEVYFYDAETNKVLIDKIEPGKNVYVQIEGLKGFTVKDDYVYPGISLKVTDSKGNILLDESDLTGGEAFHAEKFEHNVSPYFIINSDVQMQIKGSCTVWDKLSEKSITIDFTANVKK